MKNNEIMISARFEFDDKSKCQELSFLVLKDITSKLLSRLCITD